MYLIAGGEESFDALHFRPHFLGDAQLVGIVLGADGEVNGVQAIDAVVTLGSLFLADDGNQLPETDELSFPVLHVYLVRVEAVVHRRLQGQTYPLAALAIDRPEEFAGIISADGFLEVGDGDAELLQPAAVVT